MGKRKQKPLVKKEDHNKTSPNQFFDSIVGNAIDFFETSIKDFRKQPKYSIINFCSGLELILKARLLTEHWSLILKSPDKGDLIKFLNGDFLSVTVEESIDRLTKICGETFSTDEKNCLERLRDHRNKVVHFCHNAYSKTPDDILLQNIAAEQCMAWWCLHQRLVGGWAVHFAKHRQAIDRLNDALHAHHVFLKTKYKSLSPNIKKEIAAGIEYQTCSACRCHAAKVRQIQEPVHQTECQVCGKHDSFIRVACPKCGRMSDIDDLVCGVCEDENCNADITLGDAMGPYIPSHDPRDEEEPLYYCAGCEHHEQSVIRLGGQYYCFWCKDWFETEEQCEFCGEHLVGFNPSGSGYYGCFMCRTAAKEHFDRD